MIIFATNHFWVYSFLDWSKPTVAIYYVGFTIAAIILHLIWWGFTLLRNKLTHYHIEKEATLSKMALDDPEKGQEMSSAERSSE